MVPLERLQKKLASKGVHPVISPRRQPRPAPPSAPRQSWKFKVVDLMTQRVLAENADARAILELLGGIRSVVDVRIYVWRPEANDWWLLNFDEKKLLWDYRHAGSSPGAKS
jgi:hypothetical protein